MAEFVPHSQLHDAALARPSRLAAIEALGLDPSDDAFDRASRLASRALGADVGLVSIVTDELQLFAGRHGLAEPWATTRTTPLSHSFCREVVVHREPLQVDDARRDERVRANPAIDELGVEAYLGVPLFGADEEVVGSFCVIEHQPRAWTAVDLEVLSDAAVSVQRELDLRATVRELLDARRERDNLMAAVAHDLRGPVSTVAAGVELLGREDVSPQRQEELREIIRRQSGRLTGMAVRLLGGGDPEEAARFPSRQPVGRVVGDVVAARRVAGDGNRLRMEVAGDVEVVLPSEPVASIAANLVDNALGYTEGEVRLSLWRDGDRVVLRVEDDGPGYDQEAMASGRATPRGFGLGRAIVGRQVAALGGSRSVETGPDRGTTVTVHLPVGG